MATQTVAATNQRNPGNGERGLVPNPNPQALKGQLVDVANQEYNSFNNRTIEPLTDRVDAVYNGRIGGSIEAGETKAGEILPQLASRMGIPAEAPEFTPRLYRHLQSMNMTLSDFLDQIDKKSYHDGEMAELDAFQRQLAIAGIKTRGIPERGVFSDKVERFFQSNVPGSQILFPEYINRTMRQTKLAPDILPYILATTTGVAAGEAYRTIYTTDTAEDRRLFRVDQTAEMPRTKLTVSEHLIRMFKYGRILEGSYEFFRRVTIDLFAIILARIALQTNLDKATTAIDIAINGDGNSNPAANYNQSTLDTGTVPTFKGYLNFTLQFYPYQLTTLIGNASALTAFLTIQYPNINPLSILSFLQNGSLGPQKVEMPQNLYQDVQLIYLPDAPSNILIGLDKNFALEMVLENGSNLVETDRIVQRQVNDVVISEINGFAKIFPEATKTWTLNA
jgi:hypothetical protein